ncbi:G patch domain-containing protein 11 [Cytospora mali]|uniref:G patch domain-containing protein 11 n=1 Tax=Cytospora mali TaxID=578113 RepID=A0A194VRZ6_CYTMA|nr:G patch domain-containing protein 11 [Valsa mali]
MRHFSSNKFDGPGRQRSLDVEEHEPHVTSRSPSEDGNDQNVAGENKQEQDEEEEEDEEDDYMNMTFTDVAPTQPETSLQRRQRLRKEGLQRGHVPSKAELAAQERQKREEGLARSLIPDDAAAAAAAKKSKGLAMMAKMGFKPGSALGKGGGGGGARSEPLRIEVKEDRGGIGADAEKKRKVQEAAAGAAGLAKRAKLEELGDYRERMARERESARKERQVFAAQKIAERMDDERGVDGTEAAGGEGDGEEGEGKKKKKKKGGKMSSRPLKSVPVLYRGLVRQREEKERDRRMRYDLEQSSGGLSAKLPTYDDDNMDGDDKMALGRTEKKTVYMPADDLDEEDPELDEFSELDADEKLRRILKYLREKYRYCFWCKCDYPDEEMEGCPGLTEEDHD